MDTYRIINRELSLNNQELRNAVNKLKHEITYLNQQLFDQREQFLRLKESIASTIKQQYTETMDLIFPENKIRRKSPKRADFVSHRRSCDSITAADPLKSPIRSPPAASPSKELMVDTNLRTPIPRIVIHRDKRISDSPRKSTPRKSLPRKSSPRKSVYEDILENQTSDIEISAESPGNKSPDTSEDINHSSVISLSNSLHTINEEASSGVDTRNETLTDATINNLLDAPCSTPYNFNKQSSNKAPVGTKEIRVLVQKLKMDQIIQSQMNPKSFEKHSKQMTSNYKSSNDCGSLNKNQFLKVANQNPKTKDVQSAKKNKSAKRNLNALKENSYNETENTYFDDDSTGLAQNSKSLRPKRKSICFKEPSLRQKLRNTTNLKL